METEFAETRFAETEFAETEFAETRFAETKFVETKLCRFYLFNLGRTKSDEFEAFGRGVMGVGSIVVFQY